MTNKIQPCNYEPIQEIITAVTQSVKIDMRHAAGLLVHLCAVSSLVGHNVSFEGSLNSTDGVNGSWFAIMGVRTNSNTIESVSGVLAAVPVYGWHLAARGCNWVRIRAAAHTSGTATWMAQRTANDSLPIPGAQASATQAISGNLGILAGVARVGFIAGAGIWYDDTSTALPANGAFVGANRDATLTATAVAFANAATHATEIRIALETDVAATLIMEVSRDNTNWRRIKFEPLVAVSGGGFYKEIIHRPSWRYWRGGILNGASPMARCTMNSIAMAA
jgi:hypothetical protein